MDKFKRFSWTESLLYEEKGAAVRKEHLFFLDDILYELWGLGCNIILVWTPMIQGIEILTVPHYAIGDGFYIWNRDRDLNANVDLYHFMHLVLADNAIARSKARANTAPQLRTCFYVGAHYEFYQCEGLNPTTFSYIVGDVTIELADFGMAESWV